jgi:hypothetical protein
MSKSVTRRALVAGALALIVFPARAGDADVIGVQIRRNRDGSYDFDVTIRSNDTGWSFYADQFEVLAPDGRVLGTRELLHPHDDEQPFTRDLYGVRIPPGITQVVVRARHKPRGYNGATMTVGLPR